MGYIQRLMTATERRQLLSGLAFLLPWLIGLGVFLLLPIGLSLYYSFCDYNLLQEPVWIGGRNYVDLVQDGIFWKSLKNTAWYAILALPAGLLVSLGLALLLNVPTPGQSLYRTIIFLPSLVPLVASAVLWLWLFNARLGLINRSLEGIGIEGPGWLISARWAMPALAFMSLWAVGHTVVIYLAGLQDIPRQLYEAAEIDGATGLRRLWHVTLPMLSPVIFFNLVMAIIATLQVFAVPFVMTRGEPDRATYFYTMYLYDNAFTFLKMGYASAMAWVQLVMIMALTAVAFWSARKWVHYEAA
jgi:multiple sugar transport system permease protein